MIVHVHSSLALFGGAERYCVALAEAQARAGHAVTIVTAGVSPDVSRRLDQAGVKVDIIRRWRPYRGKGGNLASKALFHTLDLLDLRKIRVPHDAVVHVHRFQGLGIGTLRHSGAGTTHTVHDYALVDVSATSARDGSLINRMSLPQRLRTRWIAFHTRTLGSVIFPTHRIAERHRDLGFLHPGSVVVPHGWEQASVEPASVKGGPGITVGFVGKLESNKGADLVLTAWAHGIPGARLVVAGDGAFAREFAKAPVDFVGLLDPEGVSRLFQVLDILLVPSRWPENFPLVVAEGVLAGVAFVTTSIARPPLIEDGVNGLIVDSTPVALREAITTLVQDTMTLRRYQASSRTAAGVLDMEQHVTAISAIYPLAGR